MSSFLGLLFERGKSPGTNTNGAVSHKKIMGIDVDMGSLFEVRDDHWA
jgi:hypothetical protein